MRMVAIAVVAVVAALAAVRAALWMRGREPAPALSEATAEVARPVVAETPPAAPVAGAHAADTSAELPAVAEAIPMYLDHPHAESLPAEMAGLGAARYYVQQGHPEVALAQLERLAERYPEGALRSERIAELAIVQCALGRPAEGRAAIETLKRQSPAPAAALIARAQDGCPSGKP
jgi:hypothetical protein